MLLKCHQCSFPDASRVKGPLRVPAGCATAHSICLTLCKGGRWGADGEGAGVTAVLCILLCPSPAPTALGKVWAGTRDVHGVWDGSRTWFGGAWDPYFLTGAGLRTGSSFSHCSVPKSIRNSYRFQIYTGFPSEINNCLLTPSFERSRTSGSSWLCVFRQYNPRLGFRQLKGNWLYLDFLVCSGDGIV